MTSTRPYLLRAFYEWILDNDLTPYILVDAQQPGAYVPQEHVSEGRIVFNIAPGIVSKLNISNHMIEFDARFSGILKHISAPIKAVLAIYARENGRGMVFEEEEGTDDSGSDGEEPPPTPPRKGKPKLKVVK